MTICYFTATGNCLYVARKIGGTLLSIPQLMRQDEIEIDDEAVGIVAPVYAVEMPMMVKDFLAKAKIKTDYFFFIYTFGMGYAEAFTHVELAAREAGLTLGYINAVQMVDNYLPIFDMEEQIATPGETIVSHLMEKYGDTEETILGRMNNIREMGLKSGLDIRYTQAKCSSTFDAHRITKLAQKKGDPVKTEQLIETLYKAYFTDSLELADRKTLIKIAADCGFNSLEVTEVLNSDMFADEVRKEETEAYRSGVQGVPYFVLEGKYAISGALPEEEMVSVLKKVMSGAVS